MWPFKKSAKALDERNTIAIKLDFPAKGMAMDKIESEGRKKLKLFIEEALRRYGARGLRHQKTVFGRDGQYGRGVVMFSLPKPDPRSIEISQELGDLWHRFSGW